MNNRFITLTALAVGLAAPAARAQTTPPVLVLNIIDIQVTNDTVGGVVITSGGAGYAGNAPTVTFTGGGPPAGSAGVAMGSANLSGGGTGNNVVSVTMDPFTYSTPGGPVTVPAGGYGYITAPQVTFSGGGPASATTVPQQATGGAFLNVTQDFPLPNQT